MKIFIALAAVALITACSDATPAPAAEAATPSLRDDLTRDGACYARAYDAAHLASHPRQTVTKFYIGAAGPEWRATETPGHFNVAFGFRITGHRDLYSGIGICAPSGDDLACAVEGDGGEFTIARSGDGLRVGVQRLEVEGPNDFSPDLAQADNRVMLLPRAEVRACAAG